MTKIPTRRPRVELRADDPSLTATAGLLLVSGCARVLDVTGRDRCDRRAGGPIKRRARGVGAGELLVGLAESMVAGGDFFADLDELRVDAAGAQLRTVPGLPARTALGLAHRFDDGQIAGLRAAQGELVGRYFDALPRARRRVLTRARPTIDLDPTDVQVYGTKKERVGWSYAGMRAGRPVVVSWANAGLPVTSRLLAGDQDVRPVAPALIGEAVAALPAGLHRPIIRADCGLFSAAVARAALANEADFAIAVPRNAAVRRAIRDIPKTAWRKAKGMRGAQVATAAYCPDGFPVDSYLVVRRYPVQAAEISADARSRRRRTLDPAQLQLALDGKCEVVYAYSAFLTNLTSDVVETEACFRDRAHVEERIKDAKLGMPLRIPGAGRLTMLNRCPSRRWMP